MHVHGLSAQIAFVTAQVVHPQSAESPLRLCDLPMVSSPLLAHIVSEAENHAYTVLHCMNMYITKVNPHGRIGLSFAPVMTSMMLL